jgi:hypothetical protein
VYFEVPLRSHPNSYGYLGYPLTAGFNILLPSACARGLLSCDSAYTNNIIKIMKSRSMRWVGHVALMGEKRNVCRVLVGQPEGENYLEDTDTGWRMILKSILY